MVGFTGAINFKSNGFTEEQKNKLLKNFKAFDQTNENIEKDNFILCTYSKKNCTLSLRNNKSITLFYGRIDNLNQLRKLISVGKEFNSAEIVDIGLEKIGEEFVKEIKGAFVFWSLDLESKSLLVAKDHIGQKPLFYKVSKDSLIF